jgi:hypothetical protein
MQLGYPGMQFGGHPGAWLGEIGSWYGSARLLRTEGKGREKMLVVELRGNADAPPVTIWISAVHGDVVKVASKLGTTTFSDFRRVRGIRFPFHSDTVDFMGSRMVFEFTELQPASAATLATAMKKAAE